MVKFADKGKLIAEFARSENINDGLNSLTQINTTPDATGKLSGNAARVELNYSYKDLEMKVYHNQADREFYNTAAPITAGRKESGIKGVRNWVRSVWQNWRPSVLKICKVVSIRCFCQYRTCDQPYCRG